MGNDGRARVRLLDEWPHLHVNTTVRPTDSALMDALREHNATLKPDIEALRVLSRLPQPDARRVNSA